MGFPDDYSTGDWQITTMQDTPMLAQSVIDGMHRTMQTKNNILIDDTSSFYDYWGKPVSVPAGRNGQSRAPLGYCHALWDLETGNLITDHAGERLYRRAHDQNGSNNTLNSWYAIVNLANEYKVKGPKSSTAWDKQLLFEANKLNQKMIKGVRFPNRVYYRENGKVTMSDDPNKLNSPYLISCQTPYNEKITEVAIGLVRDITVDEHSAENLMRMFANPALEPFQQYLYIMYGGGGNGKGIILGSLQKSFTKLAHTVDARRITGGRRGDGGFSQENEMGNLMSALWAYDSEADSISLDQLTTLKRIATGDPVTAREIGQNEVKFRPQATMIIATNNPVVTTMTAASARRYVFVRMRDGRKAEDFQPLLEFIDTFGADGFLMASCELWRNHGDKQWKDVTIGSPDDLTEAQQWIVDEINDHGYAINQSNPYKQYTSELHDTIEQLGLKSTRKYVDGVRVRVLVVKDARRFNVYVRNDETQPDENATTPDIPAPIDGQTPLMPSELGFKCDYTPARSDKSAIGWKKMTLNPQADTSKIPDAPAWTVVPQPGYVIIDMDVTDKATGWQTLNQQAGAYGTPDFPRTWLVRTPHGGVHAYYKVPARLEGHLKDAVHNNGIPLDIRADQKGYVIGAGSHVESGDYQLCDLPDDQIPELSDALCDWLIDHGYTDFTDASTPVSTLRREDMNPQRRSGTLIGVGEPDMSPVPKGARNNTLHSWAFGRVVHYPGELPRIKQDLYERARRSGLQDSETESIWRSIMRQTNHAA